MLSLAMIVKNEIQTLEETILSVVDHVDEIIIGIDETSNDGSKELAEKLADRVIPIYLTEELAKKAPRNGGGDWGFSKARNDVLSVCDPKNWRLILDGHEIIHNPEKMRKVVEEAQNIGATGIEIPLHFEPVNGIPRIIYRQTRFLAPGVIYNNPIHNVPAVSKMHATKEIIVEHQKKNQNVESKKARDVQRTDSAINGLLKKIEENPKEPRTWFYLGNTYKENGLYEKAIEAYKAQLEFDWWKEQRWHARTCMGLCYSYLGDKINAREQFVLALEEFPPMAEAYYFLGGLAYDQNLFREAQVWLEKCVKMEIPDCKLFVNPKIYMLDRYDKLSMIYHHMRCYEDAIKQAEKALEVAPDERIKKNIEYWKGYLKEDG